MVKSPKQKDIIQKAVLGGGAAGGMFLGKAVNSYYPDKPDEKKKSAGLKLLTAALGFGFAAVASANISNDSLSNGVVGFGVGFGGEKLVSAASDFISTTDLLNPEIVDGKEVKDSVKDFISAGLKGTECGCNALLQRTAYPTLNFAMPPIDMIETSPNQFTAKDYL